MPELMTPDGTALEAEASAVNTEFARAMAADPGEGTPAPPRRAPVDPAAPPKRRGRPPKAERARVTSTPAKGPQAASGALSDEERVQGVKGLVQIGSGVCLLASRATAKTVEGADGKAVRQDNAAFKADAITLASNADTLAGAIVETAKHDARFAAVVDKVCAAGPYGALIAAVMGVGTQIIRNHKPGAHLPGTTDPGELIRLAEQQEDPRGTPVAA